MSLSQRAQDLLPSFETAPDLYRIPSKGETDVARRLSESGPETLGVALQLSQTGQLDAVAFATSSRVYFVPAETMCTDTAMKGLEAFFSESSSCILAGFGMARLALHIHRCTGVHMRAVDLSTLLSISTRESWPPSKVVYERMDSQVNRSRINALWLAQGDINICLRAWISACIAERFLYQVQCANKVDTRCLNIEELRCLEGLLINAELLEAAAPAEWENDFESISLEDGHYKLVNARYKSRVRASEQTEIVMETTCGRSVVGKAVGANGKSTKIAFRGPFRGEINLKSVRVVGREEATNAERAREEFVLLLLLGHFQLQTSRFIQMLWFPNEDVLLPLKKLPIASVNSFAELNRSQATVAEAMSSESIPLVIVHGPPGTGKTSTIAAAVQSWVANEESAPTWIIAQSNVGVKNIAESLLKRNIDFKLIVSKEFHFEWHEHLYDQLENHLVRSDDLGRDLVGTERLLGGSEVMLCTLSMLSNPALDTAGVYRAVPVERLVVDEASQIDTFDFMHLFHKFKNLEKVCLFGDPKQLPPYGQDIAPDMKSIFELKHLRQHAYFLNIQYRMPIPLGNFISGEVYDSKLLSEHRISAFSAVAFVDVKKGRESGGRSKEVIISLTRSN
ncbi:P-loop containing nucleoside triphosphate hydrolase protein [Obba rivulosa]|uniref:P-loop containing nucleoside triphosphate hydrolase protein n=1 Tax=Obba rivulosa TaxID=1052685 RepID=A0A8E2AXP5_9APHY|nr:P-loop containing nucleoside triphosphate hydrolase protein [Obba rivulosa]